MTELFEEPCSEELFRVERYAAQTMVTREILNMGPNGAYLVLQREFDGIDRANAAGLAQRDYDPCSEPRGEIMLRSEVRAIPKAAGLNGALIEPGIDCIRVLIPRETQL